MTTNAQEGFSMMRTELQKSTSVEIKVVKYAQQFKVTFAREDDGTSFGLELHADDSPLVSRIVLDGAVDAQNQKLRQEGKLEQVVHEGMVVKSINGNADVKDFRKLLAAETKVDLEMLRFDVDAFFAGMGHGPSQVRVGFRLATQAEETGDSADATEARKWFTEAAMQGEVAAMEWLELNGSDAAWGSTASADGLTISWQNE